MSEEILLKAFAEENFRECFARRSALADLWIQRANSYLVVHPLTEENLALFQAVVEGEASLFYLDYEKQRILEILPPGQDAWQQELIQRELDDYGRQDRGPDQILRSSAQSSGPLCQPRVPAKVLIDSTVVLVQRLRSGRRKGSNTLGFVQASKRLGKAIMLSWAKLDVPSLEALMLPELTPSNWQTLLAGQGSLVLSPAMLEPLSELEPEDQETLLRLILKSMLRHGGDYDDGKIRTVMLNILGETIFRTREALEWLWRKSFA